MRRFLIELLVVAAALSILWIAAGRQIAGWVDRFRTAELESRSVDLITYQGSGDGGMLNIGPHRFGLAPLNPHFGSTKDDQLALANEGKVFVFGPLRMHEADVLAADIQKPHVALLSVRRSYVPWLSFDRGAKPHFNRSSYFEFSSRKSDGAKLDMIWSMHDADYPTDLIRIDISNASR